MVAVVALATAVVAIVTVFVAMFIVDVFVAKVRAVTIVAIVKVIVSVTMVITIAAVATFTDVAVVFMEIGTSVAMRIAVANVIIAVFLFQLFYAKLKSSKVNGFLAGALKLLQQHATTQLLPQQQHAYVVATWVKVVVQVVLEGELQRGGVALLFLQTLARV